jgi:hypothetical protein
MTDRWLAYIIAATSRAEMYRRIDEWVTAVKA